MVELVKTGVLVCEDVVINAVVAIEVVVRVVVGVVGDVLPEGVVYVSVVARERYESSVKTVIVALVCLFGKAGVCPDR